MLIEPFTSYNLLYVKQQKLLQYNPTQSKSNLQGYKDLAILFSELAELLTAGNDFKGLILKKPQIENQTIRKEYKSNNIDDNKPLYLLLCNDLPCEGFSPILKGNHFFFS